MEVLRVRSHEVQTIFTGHPRRWFLRHIILELHLQHDALTRVVDYHYASVYLRCQEHSSLGPGCQLVDVCHRLGRSQPHKRVELDPLAQDLLRCTNGDPGHDSHIILHSVHFIKQKRACVTPNDNVAFDLDRLVACFVLTLRRLIPKLRGTEGLKLTIGCSASPPYSAKNGRCLFLVGGSRGAWHQIYLP